MSVRPPRDREYDYGLDRGERFEPVDEVDDEPFDLAQPHIMTVLGPIRPEEAGVTLPHEHLIVMPVEGRIASDPDRILDDPHATLAELEDLYSAGGRTVLDDTTEADGRDVRTLRWVAARAPVHVVTVTGTAVEDAARPLSDDLTANDIAARCIAEVVEGIDGTRVRAGAISVGTSRDQIRERESIALRGVARAQRATGAPILVRCGRGRMANEALDLLVEEGVDPERVILGHQDSYSDADELLALANRGAWISFDQIADAKVGSSAEHAAIISTLVDAGFGHRLLISGGMERRSSLRAYGGGPGLIHLVETFPLVLMEAGLSARAVRDLLVDNPAAALTIRTPATT